MPNIPAMPKPHTKGRVASPLFTSLLALPVPIVPKIIY